MATKTPPPAEELPETQIVEVDDQTSKIIAKRVTATTTGLIFSEETPFEEWEQIYATYSIIREKSNWFVGDCLRFGERFGERYAQAVHITDKSYSYLTTIVWVANQFRDLSRRHEDLPFSWHEAVAALPPQTADTILAEGKRKHWTRDDIRDAAAKARGLPTAAQKRAAKDAKKGVTLLPPAANSEPEKAPAIAHGLYWNELQLSTKDRILFRGVDKIEDRESDQCAHHHGFAHPEALMNWLEQNGFTQPPERKEGDEPCAQTTTSTSSDKSNSLPLQTASGLDTTERIESASNGASVVQPDAAPNITKTSLGTSHDIAWPTPAPGMSVWIENGEWFTASTVDPKTHGTHAYDEGGYEKGIHDCTCGCYMMSSSSGGPVDPAGACPDNPRIAPQPDSAAPKPEKVSTTPPGHPEDTGSPCVICNQPITQYDSYGVGAGIGHRYHWHCVRKEAATVGDGQPPGGQTRETSELIPEPLPPDQRAEQALATFISITQEVPWDTFGKLERKKWLKLLVPIDELIDRIANPPAPAK